MVARGRQSPGPIDGIDAGLQKLWLEARAASRRAHAPYSRFHVGAVLVDRNGRRFTGANVENASFPLGVCAERVALIRWRGALGAPIERIVVYAPTTRPTPPCGQCRDAIARWAPEAEIYLAWPRGIQGPSRSEDWLPR